MPAPVRARRGMGTQTRAAGKRAYVWGRPGCCAVLPKVGRPRCWRSEEAGDSRGAGHGGSVGSLPGRPCAAQSTGCAPGARPRRDAVADVATPLPRRAGSPDRPDSDAEGNSAHDPARVAEAERPVEAHASEDWLQGAQRRAGEAEAHRRRGRKVARRGRGRRGGRG